MPPLNFRLSPRPLAAMACLLSVCACASTAAGTATQEKPKMSQSNSSAAVNTNDVHLLNERVLAWILSVRSEQDLSAQNIEKHTGLKLWFNPEDPNDFSASGRLVAPWVYVLRSQATLPGSPPYPVSFEMWVPGNKDADRTDVCINLAHYQQPLTAAGFKSVQLVDSQSLQFWSFKKDKVALKIHLRGKTKRYDEQLCVAKIVVAASA